jgi:hypothetical protein
MKMRLPLVLASLAAVAACASPGRTAAGSGPPALAYASPEGGAATYVQADTARIDVDMGGQSLTVRQTQVATLEMTFRDVDAGVEITTVFAEFDGRVDNPMAGAQRATADAIEGPLVFVLDPRGEATVLSKPDVADEAQDMVLAESIAAETVPRLPNRPVGAGDTWTDTVRVEGEAPGGVFRTTSAVEYTVRGDTVLAGQALLRVDFVSDVTRRAELSEAGMDIIQDVAGTMRGTFYWDRARNRLHSQTQAGTFTGTMEVPGAPFPLGLTVDVVSRIGLAGS